MADASGLAGAVPGDDAMGLYVHGRKLGSVGIRVGGGISTHGLALNRDPDLTWFARMSACGAPDVPATSIAAEGGDPDRERVERALAEALADRLGLVIRNAVPAA
jgi:lipoyl(octanoyl) transferase